MLGLALGIILTMTVGISMQTSQHSPLIQLLKQPKQNPRMYAPLILIVLDSLVMLNHNIALDTTT